MLAFLLLYRLAFEFQFGHDGVWTRGDERLEGDRHVEITLIGLCVATSALNALCKLWYRWRSS